MYIDDGTEIFTFFADVLEMIMNGGKRFTSGAIYNIWFYAELAIGDIHVSGARCNPLIEIENFTLIHSCR